MIELAADPQIAERQVETLIFYLTTLGYIDREFDLREKAFVRKFLRDLVTARVDTHQDGLAPELRFEQIELLHDHYVQLFEQIDAEVRSLFTEAVAEGEDVDEFVVARLKLRCFELFEQLPEEGRDALLRVVDAFIHADGVVQLPELQFRNELAALLGEASMSEEEAGIEPTVAVEAPTQLPAAPEDHPFFQGFEHHYSSDPEKIRAQVELDLAQLDRVSELWAAQREAGEGRLRGRSHVGELEGEAFLDGHVYAVPEGGPGDFDLIVLGDLHGCYSCLKAAVIQSGFMQKVRAHRADPKNNPDVRLVLLGDYIDRGRFSFNGVLRAVLKLFQTVPENVFVLRGNHEYYIEHRGRVLSGVSPADAIQGLTGRVPDAVFARYLQFFERMPNVLLWGNLMFVHGGVPRERLVESRYVDLASLNDPELRFQMLWSDPSTAERVPDSLQAATARFAFGRAQFRSFMRKVGCSLMIRGHEKVNTGFRVSYPRDEVRLVTLFSAGGVANDDLPPDSNYRDVRPMALTISRRGNETKVTPWAIDYRSYQDPGRNAFFRDAAELTSPG